MLIHALERLWKIPVHTSSRSAMNAPKNMNPSSSANYLTFSRTFCWLRSTMNLFYNNLFYYYQIDVIDAEYHTFCENMEFESMEFESLVRAHKIFISNIMTQCMLDNTVIQDVLDNLLHITIRFLAVCKILLEDETSEDSSKNIPPIIPAPPLYLPIEELDALSSEFTAQLTYLVHVMMKLDTGNIYVYLYMY